LIATLYLQRKQNKPCGDIRRPSAKKYFITITTSGGLAQENIHLIATLYHHRNIHFQHVCSHPRSIFISHETNAPKEIHVYSFQNFMEILNQTSLRYRDKWNILTEI
jgi:hypothetical protein